MHLEVALLRLSVLETVVEIEVGQRAQPTTHIVVVGLFAEVYEVDAVGTFGFWMREQFAVVAHLAAIERHVTDAEVAIVLVGSAGFGKSNRATLVQWDDKAQVGPRDVNNRVEHQFVVQVNTYVVIRLGTPLSQCTHSKRHVVKLTGHVELPEG